MLREVKLQALNRLICMYTWQLHTDMVRTIAGHCWLLLLTHRLVSHGVRRRHICPAAELTASRWHLWFAAAGLFTCLTQPLPHSQLLQLLLQLVLLLLPLKKL
jgi:hypothetical protein